MMTVTKRYNESVTTIIVPLEIEAEVCLTTEFNPGYPGTRETPPEPAGHEIQRINYKLQDTEIREQIDSWIDRHWSEIEFQ